MTRHDRALIGGQEPPPDRDIESRIMEGIENTVLDEASFEKFRKEKEFLDGLRGTYRSENKQVYLYIKPDHRTASEAEAINALKACRYLTERGVLYPNTKWGAFRSSKGFYQLFAVTRRLENWSRENNTQEGRQHLLDDLRSGKDRAKMFQQDSHILEWFKRADPNFDVNVVGPEDSLVRLLNQTEASHPSNWAWDENGILYPIDVEVIRISGIEPDYISPYGQSVIEKWVRSHESKELK